MSIKLEANMQHCPHSGYIAWIENSGNFNMVVQGSTAESAAKELIISLKVAMAHISGGDIESIKEKIEENAIYLELVKAPKD
jgi:hypothetical protein